ncbi:hypothetical protein CGH27_25590, partial [Vibrio parahaemolyticus]
HVSWHRRNSIRYRFIHMIWDSATGLTPDDFDTIIEAYFEAFKESDDKFSGLAFNTFVASDEYKVFYAS